VDKTWDPDTSYDHLNAPVRVGLLKRILQTLGCAMLVSANFASLSSSPNAARAAAKPAAPSQQKSVIEIGRDAPSPEHVRVNIKTMEQRPLHGTMINLTAGKTIFNRQAYRPDAFTKDRAALRATKSTKLTDNFITIWSARESGWDWFNNVDWMAAETNTRNFARTASAGSIIKGFAFDPEPYGTNPWTYNATLYPNKSLPEVRSQVRKRGAAFMKAIQKEMPKVKILTLFGMSYVKAEAEAKGSVDKIDWVLYPAFFDGMLDVIGPEAQLIDGNESSYYFTDAKDFVWARGEFKSAREYVSPGNRAKYDRQVTLANAVFLDGLLNAYETPRFFGYFLASDDERRKVVEHHLYHGLKNSDRYVWFYNETPDWWGTFGRGVRVPPGMHELTIRATKNASTNQPLGFEVAPFLPAAAQRLRERVDLSGRVLSKGQPIGDFRIDAGFRKTGNDLTCVTNVGGYFTCSVPKGWSGELTPSAKGYTFTPPKIAIVSVQTMKFDYAIEATRA
jgi:hypothetical protein